jgi:aminopeptidase YwaD
MNPIKKILVLVFFTSTTNLFAQDMSYAKKVIPTLSSSYYFGRGYLNNGHLRAANFIENEFRKLGLQSFNTETYFQSFDIQINTHPKNSKLSIDRQSFIFGSDYLFTPNSPSIKKEYKIRSISAKKLEQKSSFGNKYKHRAVWIKTKDIPLSEKAREAIYSNKIGAEVILVPSITKLTHRMSQKQSNFSVIELSKDAKIPKHKILDLEINAVYFDSLETQNVIGFVKGTEKPDSFIVFSAHYDHLGGVGDVYFPGANDNASGIAMLLTLAKHYASNPSKYSVVFMAFGAEEVGLLGSKYFVENPLFSISSIKFLINMDMMGTGDEGLQVVNGSVFTQAFDQLKNINEEKKYLPQIKVRGKSANSDHHWFTEQGVPSFFVYTLGGVTHYHDIHDQAKTLPLTKFEEVFSLLIDFMHTFE